MAGYSKNIDNIILNEEMLKVFPLKLETTQENPLTESLFNILKALAKPIRQLKVSNRIQRRKQNFHLFIYLLCI